MYFFNLCTGLEEDKSERDDSDTTQSEFDVEPLPNHNLNPPVETHYEENRTEELGAVSMCA